MIISYVHIQWVNCVLSAITCSSQLCNEQEFLILPSILFRTASIIASHQEYGKIRGHDKNIRHAANKEIVGR